MCTVGIGEGVEGCWGVIWVDIVRWAAHQAEEAQESGGQWRFVGGADCGERVGRGITWDLRAERPWRRVYGSGLGW